MYMPISTKIHKKIFTGCYLAMLLCWGTPTKCFSYEEFFYAHLYESPALKSEHINALLTKLQYPANKRTDKKYQALITMPNQEAMSAIFKKFSLEEPCRGSNQYCNWSREGSLSFWLNEKTISFGELLGTLDRAMKAYYLHLEEKGNISTKKLKDRVINDKKNIEKAVLALLNEPNQKISDIFLAKYLGVSNSPKNKAAMHQMQKNYGIQTPKRNSAATIAICKKIMVEEAVFLENACL